MELQLIRPKIHRVCRGQTLSSIARTFGVTPRVLAAANNLICEVEEGQLLTIPPAGNLYRVRGGESCTLLCGSLENFQKRNVTEHLYPTQEVLL